VRAAGDGCPRILHPFDTSERRMTIDNPRARRIRPHVQTAQERARRAVDDVRESVERLLAEFAAARLATARDGARSRARDLDAISGRVDQITSSVQRMMDDLGDQRRATAGRLHDELAEHAASITAWVQKLRAAAGQAAGDRAAERRDTSRQAAEARAEFVADLIDHCSALRDEARELAQTLRTDRQHAAATDTHDRARHAEQRRAETAELLASFRDGPSERTRAAAPRAATAKAAKATRVAATRSAAQRPVPYIPSIASAFVPLPPPPPPPPATNGIATTRSPMAGIGKATRKPRRS